MVLNTENIYFAANIKCNSIDLSYPNCIEGLPTNTSLKKM
ncbi:hypothetical protein FDUTEX481_08957 [Tolypothrix sp. PCC 7601]|nr:hypothetical protein FDUTEX481_08957 [Tolypothrix sp. PCC 7601]